MQEIDQLCINTIRMLGMDAINQANSGHPGMVLGSAPTMYTLYNDFINTTPKDYAWINRDRFVLASGHASMLLYATLHLCGCGAGNSPEEGTFSIETLKHFRQLHSDAPGHPEYSAGSGIDATSGPLGQGIAHAVGMAMAEAHLAAIYNKEGYPIINHYTYALCGDGDLHEGVTQEAISLAGHLKLNKLIVLYDRNNVTLDGALNMSFEEDVKKRFESCGWNVLQVKDANIIKDTKSAIKKAQKSKKPTLIIITSIIGYLSTNQNTNKVHGSPIGVADTDRIKQEIGWKEPPFTVPSAVYEQYKEHFYKRSKAVYNRWRRMMISYRVKYPELAKQLQDSLDGNLPDITYPSYEIGYVESTRKTSGKVINAIAPQLPYLIGGAADVAGSVMTKINDAKTFDSSDYSGRNINYGIREFAMSCAQTGMLLHGGIKSFIGSFLVFSDYFKASIRTTALMKIPAIYVLTHDSIAVGEDGPTHQPIEQISALRLIPNTIVLRPCDANETALAWRYALQSKDKPTCLILSRQDLITAANPSYEDYLRGAYVVSKEKNVAQLTLLATGSEVHLAIEVQNELIKHNIDSRVVSLTSMELFDRQPASYRAAILGNSRSKVVALEMGRPDIWYKYAKQVFGITSFGASGKAKDVIDYYGFTATKIVEELL